MPNVKMQWKKEAAKTGAEWKKGSGGAKSEPFSSFASEEAALEKRPWQGRRAETGGGSREGHMEADGNTKAWFRELEIDLSSARRVERSTDCHSASGVERMATVVRTFQLR